MRHALRWTALAILLLVPLAAPGGSAITPAEKCAAAKRKLAGKKLVRLTVCDAKAVLKGAGVDPTCESKATTAFMTERWPASVAPSGGTRSRVMPRRRAR